MKEVYYDDFISGIHFGPGNGMGIDPRHRISGNCCRDLCENQEK